MKLEKVAQKIIAKLNKNVFKFQYTFCERNEFSMMQKNTEAITDLFQLNAYNWNFWQVRYIEFYSISYVKVKLLVSYNEDFY